jgi:hypothetical protein
MSKTMLDSRYDIVAFADEEPAEPKPEEITIDLNNMEDNPYIYPLVVSEGYHLENLGIRLFDYMVGQYATSAAATEVPNEYQTVQRCCNFATEYLKERKRLFKEGK